MLLLFVDKIYIIHFPHFYQIFAHAIFLTHFTFNLPDFEVYLKYSRWFDIFLADVPTSHSPKWFHNVRFCWCCYTVKDFWQTFSSTYCKLHKCSALFPELKRLWIPLKIKRGRFVYDNICKQDFYNAIISIIEIVIMLMFY